MTGEEGLEWRSTPTRVGKTGKFPHSVIASSVHPHACGENSERTVRKTIGEGPPPRVWGKRQRRLAGLSEGRSTPTRVGKTIQVRS